MKILLADDHAMFRSGLRRILQEGIPGAQISESGSCEETLSCWRRESWELLILDIAMGGQSSLQILPTIKTIHPKVPVLVLSMYNDQQFVIQALRGGASGYLTKENAPEELIRAVRTVTSGRRYMSGTMAEQIAEHLVAGAGGFPSHQALSSREYEVFLAIAEGRPLTEIASQLKLSVKTISTYRTRILEKTGLRSNAEIIRYAVRNGLSQEM